MPEELEDLNPPSELEPVEDNVQHDTKPQQEELPVTSATTPSGTDVVQGEVEKDVAVATAEEVEAPASAAEIKREETPIPASEAESSSERQEEYPPSPDTQIKFEDLSATEDDVEGEDTPRIVSPPVEEVEQVEEQTHSEGDVATTSAQEPSVVENATTSEADSEEKGTNGNEQLESKEVQKELAEEGVTGGDVKIGNEKQHSDDSDGDFIMVDSESKGDGVEHEYKNSQTPLEGEGNDSNLNNDSTISLSDNEDLL
jgi:hypothetical protein